MFGWIRRRRPIILAQWYVPLLDFESSSGAFYEALEQDVRTRFLPSVAVERIDFRQFGILSGKRAYLRLRRERLVCDVCSGAFGACWWFSARAAVLPRALEVYEIVLVLLGMVSFYVMDWNLFGLVLGSILFFLSLVFILLVFLTARRWSHLDDFLIFLPVLGSLYEAYVRRDTYHQQDERRMFAEIANSLVKLKVVEFCAAGGIEEPVFIKVDSPEQVITERQLSKYLGPGAARFT